MAVHGIEGSGHVGEDYSMGVHYRCYNITIN